MPKTASSVAEKWARRISASTQDVIDGVNNTRVNPAELAIAKKQKLLANFQASVNDGRWERGLRRTTLQSWQQAMITKGVNRIAQGADAAKPKMQAFMQELLPYQDSVRSEIEAMPDITLEDSIARMTQWTRKMSQFQRNS